METVRMLAGDVDLGLNARLNGPFAEGLSPLPQRKEIDPSIGFFPFPALFPKADET
jgi:hypothetical protein